MKSKFFSSNSTSPSRRGQGWVIQLTTCHSTKKNFKIGNSKLKNSEKECEEIQLLSPSFEIKKKENCSNKFTMTFSETQSENSEDWRDGPFCNIIFDKKAVSKEAFHNHLIRTYEGLTHANSLNFLITTEMINRKSIELKRRGKTINFRRSN